MFKEAIVLAGGLGTRLKSVVKDVPKPMANINGRPFLEYLLSFLKEQNMEKVILSVGYKYEIIKKYFGNNFEGMKLVYSIEERPLGTGGAVKRSLSLTDNKEVFVFNGDTIFKINLEEFFLFHQKKKSVLSIALKFMRDFDRYGSVKIDDTGRIIGFEEKKYYKEGLINGGIYLLNREFFLNFNLKNRFSFEKEFLEKYYAVYKFYGLVFNDFFIDIGVPDDYEKCKSYFKFQEKL